MPNLKRYICIVKKKYHRNYNLNYKSSDQFTPKNTQIKIFTKINETIQGS